MKKLDLGQTLTILANVGVILGIVFLAVEINQATRATVAAASDSVVTGYNDLNANVISDPQVARTFIVGLYEPDKLTDVEAVQFAMWVRSYGNQILRIRALTELGFFSESFEARGGDIRQFAHILSTPGGRQFLESNRQAFPTWLLDEIEPFLGEEPTFDWILGRDPRQID